MLKFEDVQEFVKGRDIAVVGNARSLLGKSQGVLIDKHDIVIRLNLGVPGVDHPALGNPDVAKLVTPMHIGKRMDVWAGVQCPGHPKIADGRIHGIKMVGAINLKEWNAIVQQCWVVPFGAWWPVKELLPKTFDGAQIQADSKLVVNEGRKTICMPTTGFTVSYMLTERCEPSSVTLYGFDGFETTSYPSGMTGAGHDGAHEMRWLMERVEMR